MYASKAETVVRTHQWFKENDSLRVGVVSNLWSDRYYEKRRIDQQAIPKPEISALSCVSEHLVPVPLKMNVELIDGPQLDIPEECSDLSTLDPGSIIS